MGAPEPAEWPAEPGSPRWWLERQARLDRRRPRADGLTVEQIVEAALAIVDDEGLDALTVRHLASRLETGSATLYRHVASRDELLVLLVDRVIGEVEHPPADVRGRRRVVCLSTELRRVLMAHPNLVPALRAAPLAGPNAMRGSADGLTSLLDAGYEPAVALDAYLALVDYVLGTVFFDTGRAGRWHLDAGAGEHGERLALAAEHFPALARFAEVAQAPDADGVFVFGLQAFLDGLDARVRTRDR